MNTIDNEVREILSPLAFTQREEVHHKVAEALRFARAEVPGHVEQRLDSLYADLRVSRDGEARSHERAARLSEQLERMSQESSRLRKLASDQGREIATLKRDLQEARSVVFRDSKIETVHVSPGDKLCVETTLRRPGSYRRETIKVTEEPMDPNDDLRAMRQRDEGW